jgi:PAS domain S-box-containing protein
MQSNHHMAPLYTPESINSYFIEQIKNYAIFSTDTEGIVNTWNIGAQRIKGYKEDEIIGKYYGILHPDEYQNSGVPEREMESALKNGVYETEDWRKRKDGSLFWASVTLTPIFSKDGKHVGYTKITGDITKQKELQDKLAERQKDVLEHKNDELRKVNIDLENFVYTASHDLHSPIANIEALVDILKKRITQANCMTPGIEEVVNRITDSGNRLKRTIVDLTEISKMQHDLQEKKIDDIVDIREVYDDIVSDITHSSGVNPCFFKTDFQVNQVKFSYKNFRSILFNLIHNATKFKSPERDCVIEVNTRLEERYVVLSVKDNGVGISQKHQEQLYTMFKRFHHNTEGTGVGLFMVKRIIENGGGKITVESEVGQGTQFNVYFRAAV